jgi:hypothetical protein
MKEVRAVPDRGVPDSKSMLIDSDESLKRLDDRYISFIRIPNMIWEKYIVFTRLFYKKSLCAEYAEASSERNLYAPPLGFGIKLSLPVNSFISINSAFPCSTFKVYFKYFKKQIKAAAFFAFKKI